MHFKRMHRLKLSKMRVQAIQSTKQSAAVQLIRYHTFFSVTKFCFTPFQLLLS